jgi:N-acetyl-gamma-glutamylphosphate reductase
LRISQNTRHIYQELNPRIGKTHECWDIAEKAVYGIPELHREEIRKAKGLGLVDGVTTNPTLLAKEGEETETLIRKISKEVRGPVNVEATGITSEEIFKGGKVDGDLGR